MAPLAVEIKSFVDERHEKVMENIEREYTAFDADADKKLSKAIDFSLKSQNQ